MDTQVGYAAAAETSFSRRYTGWLLFVLLAVCAINYADRSVVGAVAEPLRRELGLSDFQLGLLQGLSFALLYSVLGIPFARLAERRNRVRIIAAATFVWSLMTALCGAAANFVQLLIMRVGVGVGEAGFMAPATSLLGDHFRRDRRAFATSIMMLGVPFGALIGAMSGGWIAQSIGWRWAFLIMGAPGILIALLVLLTLREPPRGHIEGDASTDVPPLSTVARKCFSDPVFRHVLAGGTLGGFGLHGLGQFLGVYLVRVHELPYGLAGMIYGLVTFASVGGGLLVGGFLADRMGRRSLRWYSLIPAIGMFLSAPLYIGAFRAETLAPTVTLLLVAGISLLLHYGPGLATIQNLASSRTRASTIALYMLVVNAVSMGFAAPLIGFLSDTFAAQVAAGLGASSCAASTSALCLQAQGTGLQYALMASTVLYVWAGVHYLMAARRQAT
ncbi:MAG: MFS transporter [Steroidobacteraceae bacterium]|nr:MFS transporter [Steroidobacteraceae bacterium]